LDLNQTLAVGGNLFTINLRLWWQVHVSCPELINQQWYENGINNLAGQQKLMRWLLAASGSDVTHFCQKMI